MARPKGSKSHAKESAEAETSSRREATSVPNNQNEILEQLLSALVAI